MPPTPSTSFFTIISLSSNSWTLDASGNDLSTSRDERLQSGQIRLDATGDGHGHQPADVKKLRIRATGIVEKPHSYR
jgi:hypothetical protein